MRIPLVLAVLSVFGCQLEKDRKGDREDLSGAGSTARVSLDVERADGAALTAAPVTDVKVQLVCDGFTGDVPKLPLEIYGEPTGCTLRLRGFTLGGVTFLPKEGADFKTFAVGDKATFTDGATELSLQVEAQLPAKIVADSVTRYGFSQVQRDPDVHVEKPDFDVTVHDVIVDGEPPPGLKLTKMKLVAMSTTSAIFKLSFACDEPLVGTDAATVTCKGDRVAELLLHTSRKPDGDITAAVLAGLFAERARAFGDIPGLKIVDGLIEVSMSSIELGCEQLSELSKAVVLVATRCAAGKSYRYSLAHLPQFSDVKNRSCKLKGKTTIPHGTVYEDTEQPRYKAPKARPCKVVGFAKYTCNDGTLKGPEFPANSFPSCEDEGGPGQTPHQGPAQTPVQTPHQG